MDDHRRASDRWHVLEIAAPVGALFLLVLGFTFAWAVVSMTAEQSRLRYEHGQLMTKIVESCRRIGR